MWYIVLSRSLPEKDQDKERNYEAHRQWLDDQHRAGRLLFSGPTTDGKYGVYIVLASSLDEAKSIAAQNGGRTARFAWTVLLSPRWK
jgi:uncharacterized protein YciI